MTALRSDQPYDSSLLDKNVTSLPLDSPSLTYQTRISSVIDLAQTHSGQ